MSQSVSQRVSEYRISKENYLSCLLLLNFITNLVGDNIEVLGNGTNRFIQMSRLNLYLRKMLSMSTFQLKFTRMDNQVMTEGDGIPEEE